MDFCIKLTAQIHGKLGTQKHTPPALQNISKDRYCCKYQHNTHKLCHIQHSATFGSQNIINKIFLYIRQQNRHAGIHQHNRRNAKQFPLVATAQIGEFFPQYIFTIALRTFTGSRKCTSALLAILFILVADNLFCITLSKQIRTSGYVRHAFNVAHGKTGYKLRCPLYLSRYNTAANQSFTLHFVTLSEISLIGNLISVQNQHSLGRYCNILLLACKFFRCHLILTVVEKVKRHTVPKLFGRIPQHQPFLFFL